MTFNLRPASYYLFAIISCFHACTCSHKAYEPVRSDEYRDDQSARHRYHADEILIMYKGVPTPEKRDTIRQALLNAGVDTASVTIKTCNSCNAYVELWQAAEIHTVIHDEGIRAGTVSGGTKGVGEDSLARYSLNYIQHLPVDDLPDLSNYVREDRLPPMSGTGKDTITIAVLDTGVDPNVVSSNYLWRNAKEISASATDPDGNCYEGDRFGWNFVNQSPDIREDHPSMHGTLVSEFIVQEFEASARNFPQVMTLKTHDNQGGGDLFSSICAMHYAIDKGANIINASWGFYYYDEDPHPYLDSLVTHVMREKGIIFVTASGNKIDAVDEYAQLRYQAAHGDTLPARLLRNLEIHNFYPACIAEADNNVFVATTTNGSLVSPTQNYSNRYVDFGVVADTVAPDFMKFQVPFTTFPIFISGSSFATAILAGKIGAFAERVEYSPNVSKQQIINSIESGSPGVIKTSADLDDNDLVRDGRYIERQ